MSYEPGARQRRRDLPTGEPDRTAPVAGGRRPGRRGGAADPAAAGAAAALFAAAALVGQRLHRVLYARWPPLIASWRPHAGPGTAPALLVAGAAVAAGPRAARRVPAPLLPWATWLAALAWTWSLALVDGWYRGVAHRIDTPTEYLRAVGRVHDIGATLHGFTGHILLGHTGNWPVHVAGHPPGALLVFVWLDRIGLGGGGWAATACITVGTSGAAAVLVALRALGAGRAARRAAPFLALAPAAIWIGASADGLFAGVAAWGAALLAVAAARPARRPAALAGGVLLGFALYLSYGLAVFGLIAAAVLAAACDRPGTFLRTAAVALAGAAGVAAAFTAAGFDWLAGYRLLTVRYYQGVASVRPYGYWIWANLAALALCVGPATVAALRRAVTRRPDRAALPVLAALAAVAAADLSGMSKGETERIWLPFALWLLPAAALLPARRHRHWLAAQAATALLANHLLFTSW